MRRLFFKPISHYPVFGYAILAVAAAMGISACLLFFGPDDRPRGDDLAIENEGEGYRGSRILHMCAGGLLSVLLLLVLATPWRSFHQVDARRDLFADETAREMLTVMKERTWLISNGYLDNHLLIQAHMLNKPLTLITLRLHALPQEEERTRQLIASSPVFAGQNRQRLQNALSLGMVRFVMEWFTTDPQAGSRAMVLATPDIWTACGYRAVPEGLAFGGVHPDQKVDLTKIEEENRTLTDRIIPLLLKQDEKTGYVATLGEMLRMKAGLAANELGVMLEDLNQTEAAYQAYARASQIDPMNISAAINGYTLASRQKIHPEALDRLKAKIKTAMTSRSYQAQGLTGIFQNYGTIRQQAFYQQQAVLWSFRGAPAVATDKNRKALALSEQTGVAALVENALFYVQANDFAKAEACYLAALEKDDSNKGALFGLSVLMILQRNTPAAEKWMQKALAAGVGKDDLLYQTIKLAILKEDFAQALTLLTEATKKYPKDLRYWTLQVDLLLNQGDTQLVEHTVLPKMQKALNNPNHFLIHTVRGFLLRKKGPGQFKAARLSLLRALSLNAALPDIWSALFELDLALGNPEFTEMDARNLLNSDPDHAFANYLMGSLLMARGKLQEAEDFLRRSIEKLPTAAACNDLGENLRRQNKLVEAESFARQACVLDPKLLHALDTLACILFDAGKYDEAAQTATQAVASRPDCPAYQFTLLRAQIKQGDKNGVLQRLDALAEVKVDIPEALQKEILDMK
ncbi:MAG: tetratricopeptide repeat protein [bacterium]